MQQSRRQFLKNMSVMAAAVTMHEFPRASQCVCE